MPYHFKGIKHSLYQDTEADDYRLIDIGSSVNHLSMDAGKVLAIGKNWCYNEKSIK